MIVCTQFLLRLLGPSLGKNQGTMASADFLQFVVTAAFGFFPYTPSARPPRVKATTLFPCNRHIYRTGFGQHWTLCWIAHSSVPVRPTMWFLFAGSGVCPPTFFFSLTSGFLQIPLRDETVAFGCTLAAIRLQQGFVSNSYWANIKQDGKGVILLFRPVFIFYNQIKILS